jgi:hypothetical protein
MLCRNARMQLGEQLVQNQQITREQLETALRAQLQFGGRIGTNLLELGFLDPDSLARALSRKLGVPPALYKHFGTIETGILALFSAKFADRYKAIPLGLTMTTPHRLVVAFMDPIPANIDEVAFAVGRRIEPGVAPELLIVHCLERFYGVKRASRYVRVNFGAQEGLPQVAAVAPPPPPPSAPRPAVPGLKAPYVAHSAAAVQAAMAVTAGNPPRASSDELAPPEWLNAPAPKPRNASVSRMPSNEEILRAASADGAGEVAVANAVVASPAISARVAPIETVSAVYAANGIARMPMESIAESEYGEFDPTVPVLEPYEDVSETGSLPPAAAPRISEYDPNIPLLEPCGSVPPEPTDIARLPVPRVSMPAAALDDPDASDDEWDVPVAKCGITEDEAVTSILAAESKEHIGDALCGYLKSSFRVGLVLILKDDMALGWKGFAADVDQSTLEAISVPVTGPSMFKSALDTRSLFKGTPPVEGAAVQTRLWKLLRSAPPNEVVVAPVVLGKRVVNLVYGHGVAVASASVLASDELARVCEAAAAGYMRLIRTGR